MLHRFWIKWHLCVMGRSVLTMPMHAQHACALKIMQRRAAWSLISSAATPRDTAAFVFRIGDLSWYQRGRTVSKISCERTCKLLIKSFPRCASRSTTICLHDFVALTNLIAEWTQLLRKLGRFENSVPLCNRRSAFTFVVNAFYDFNSLMCNS